MILTHQVQCLCSVSLNRQTISASKLDLLSFLNFPQGRMILLYNKHYGSSPSLRRVAQILESNCLQTLGGRVGGGAEARQPQTSETEP